jgi:hypothetical protein
VTVAYETVVNVTVCACIELEVVDVVVTGKTTLSTYPGGCGYMRPATCVLLDLRKPEGAAFEKKHVPGPTPITPPLYQKPVQPERVLQMMGQSFQLLGAGCCANEP